MANATIILSVIKTGYVDKSQPYTVIPTSSSADYYINDNTSKNYTMLYFGFQKFPDELRYRPLIDLQIKARIKSTSSVGGWFLACNDFDPATLTYNTRPSETTASNASPYYAHTNNQWADVTATKSGGLSGVSIKKFLTSSCFNIDDICYSKTVLGNGTAPYVTVTYDNSAYIHSKVELDQGYYLHGTVDNGVEQECKWKLFKDSSQASYICLADTWTQLEANFYWREQGETNWNVINIEGAEQSITFPAFYFGTAKAYEYYVEVTDNTNTTTQTTVHSFTTPQSQIMQENSPVSGYVNPRTATTFGWYFGNTAGSVLSGEATLYWRETGETNWNVVTPATGATSVTIAENTFPIASFVEWYLSGTDYDGYTSQTDVYEFSTTAAEMFCELLAPINTIENNNDIITFSWKYVSDDNMPASRCIVEYKASSSDTWLTLIDSPDGITTYTAAANTFPTNEINWRVTPYNIDETAGTASEATFISYGAPPTPVVYAEAVPFTTVTWQSQGQEAYDVMVDGKIYGTYYGTEKEFVLPEKLDDGTHVIKVRVLGNYAIWSEWGETGVTVTNIPGLPIELEAQDGVDITLVWATQQETSDFQVYRDDEYIGHTYQKEFTDRFVLGTHEYKVINQLPDGNYVVSNTVEATASVDGTYISLVTGGKKIKIEYTLKDSSDPVYEESIETAYSHLAGNEYPSVIISPYKESSLPFSAVFLYNQEEDHAYFRSLFGKAVMLKMKDGTVHIGIMDSWTRTHRKSYYTAYSFTIRRVQWGNFVDDTQ